MTAPRRYTPAQRALIDQVRTVLRYSPGNKHHVALAMHMSPSALVRRLQRADRHDLVQRMAAHNVIQSDGGWSCGVRSCQHCGEAAHARKAAQRRRAS